MTQLEVPRRILRPWKGARRRSAGGYGPWAGGNGL